MYNGASKGILSTYTTPAITGDSTMYIKAQPLYDFEIVSVVPGVARVGVPMFFSVKFTNNGIEHSAVPMDLKIGSLVLHSSAAIIERGEAYCFFDWTPTTAGTFDLELIVNPGNVIEEKDYTNNTLSSSLTVLPAFSLASPSGDPTPRYPSLPSGENNIYSTWEENGTTYWARLNFSASFSEPDIDPMRSGYGVSVRASAEVTHNYYNAERISDPVGVIMLLPEYDYKEGVALEHMPDGTWQLPINTTSPTSARRWYIPTEYADGEVYAVLFQCYGVSTPGGELTSAKTDEKEIRGSMYDDDYTIGA